MIGRVVNVPLMANPMNWITVLLMVMLASIGIHYVFQAANATTYIVPRS